MKKLEIHNSSQAVISQVAVWRLLSQENTETQRAQEWSDANLTKSGECNTYDLSQ